MQKCNLAVIPVKKLDPITPAAFYEREAAMYLRINIHTFRELVREGNIPFVKHIGRTRRVFLKMDLDDYLARLTRNPEGPGAYRENS